MARTVWVRPLENDRVEMAKHLLARGGKKLELPVDACVASSLDDAKRARNVRREAIPANEGMYDIGTESAQQFAKIIANARTIVWNGPMGVFEKPPFDKGTVALAKAVAASDATSVVGGGDSEKAIKAAGVAEGHGLVRLTAGG